MQQEQGKPSAQTDGASQLLSQVSSENMRRQPQLCLFVFITVFISAVKYPSGKKRQEMH